MRKASRMVAEEEPSEGLSDLAEQLIRQAAADVRREDGVLLDLERDGVRCVVVRATARPAVAPRPSVGPRADALSPREREIARMVAEGYPNKTIAAVLDISLWTVNTYLRRMFTKLGVTSRAAMVAKLMER